MYLDTIKCANVYLGETLQSSLSRKVESWQKKNPKKPHVPFNKL